MLGGDVEAQMEVRGLIARAQYTVQLVVQSADGVWRATPLHMIAAGPDETLLQVQLQLPAEVLRVRVTAPVKDVRIHLVDSFPGLGEGESLLATTYRCPTSPDRARQVDGLLPETKRSKCYSPGTEEILCRA